MDYPIQKSFYDLKYDVQITQSLEAIFYFPNTLRITQSGRYFCGYQMSFGLYNPKGKLNVIFNLLCEFMKIRIKWKFMFY